LIEDLHSQATPTLVMGEKVVIGFDAAEYEAALRSIQT